MNFCKSLHKLFAYFLSELWYCKMYVRCLQKLSKNSLLIKTNRVDILFLSAFQKRITFYGLMNKRTVSCNAYIFAKFLQIFTDYYFPGFQFSKKLMIIKIFNEHMGVSNENTGSPMNRGIQWKYGGLYRKYGSPMTIWGLQWEYVGFQWKFGSLQQESGGLQQYSNDDDFVQDSEFELSNPYNF